jgi:hypothetical protein
VFQSVPRDRVLPVAFAILLLAGCRPPPGVPLRGGDVNASVLVRAHPSWPQVTSLEARIRGLERGVPPVAALPPPREADTEAAAEAFPDLEPSLGLAERRELQALIRQRVEADYEVLVTRLDQEVRRYAAGQEAAALARAEEGIARRTDQFRSEYLEVVRRYADLLGPLLLLQVALMPGAADLIFYPPQVLDERGRRRTELDEEIAARRSRMDRELTALTLAFRQEVAARRAVARKEAAATAEQYRQARLSSLQSDRERQRRALEADLDRALQEASLPPAPPITAEESVFEGRRGMAARVLQANAQADRVQQAADERRAAALVVLRQERQQLVTMIDRATRALAETVAREEQFDLRWVEDAGDPQLTERLLAGLRERWAAPSATDPLPRGS